MLIFNPRLHEVHCSEFPPVSCRVQESRDNCRKYFLFVFISIPLWWEWSKPIALLETGVQSHWFTDKLCNCLLDFLFFIVIVIFHLNFNSFVFTQSYCFSISWNLTVWYVNFPIWVKRMGPYLVIFLKQRMHHFPIELLQIKALISLWYYECSVLIQSSNMKINHCVSCFTALQGHLDMQRL